MSTHARTHPRTRMHAYIRTYTLCAHWRKIYPDLYRRMSMSCRTCNCAVSWRRSLTVLLSSSTSLSAGSGCGENFFMISRILQYGASGEYRSAIHMLYAIRAGTERSIVAILSRRFLWRPIKSHRRPSIPDTMFIRGESESFAWNRSNKNRTFVRLTWMRAARVRGCCSSLPSNCSRTSHSRREKRQRAVERAGYLLIVTDILINISRIEWSFEMKRSRATSPHVSSLETLNWMVERIGKDEWCPP